MRKRKQGFAVPLREWLKTGLREMVGDLLESGSGHLPQAMFNDAGIKKLLEEHRRSEADHSAVVWLLLNYAAWHTSFIGTPSSRPWEQHTARIVA